MGKISRREKKLRDIQYDDRGSAVYTGAIYRIAGDGGRIRRYLALGLAGLFAAVIGSGCIDAAGATNSFYVILPFLGEVCALFARCWNAVKVIAGRDGVRAYVHEAAEKILPGACRILTVFALFGLAASVFYLLKNGMGGQSAKSLAYLVLKVLAAAGAERYARAWRGLSWETVQSEKSA